MERKLAAILYADVAGFSRLTGADEKGTFTSTESAGIRPGTILNLTPIAITLAA